MDWEWSLGPCDQTAPEPTPETLARDLAEFVEAYADDYARHTELDKETV